MKPAPLSPTEAAALLSGPFVREDLVLDPCPMITVDLASMAEIDETTGAQLAHAVATVPAVIVGVVSPASGPAMIGLAELCDVIICTAPHPRLPAVVDASPARKIEQLRAAVAARPIAAVTLAELLRLSETATPREALLAESLTYSTLLGGPEFAAWLDAGPRPTPPVMSADNPVLIERTWREPEGTRLTVTLNDPRRRNAFSASMRDAVVEAFRVGNTDPSIDEILVRGAGPSFCAGGDLSEFGTTPDPATGHRIRIGRNAAAMVLDDRDRYRFEVHGHAIGAGIEIAAGARMLAADPKTLFQLPELQMGLIPGAGGTATIPRRIGRHRTLWMALSGEMITAPTALDWGLIDTIVPVDGA